MPTVERTNEQRATIRRSLERYHDRPVTLTIADLDRVTVTVDGVLYAVTNGDAHLWTAEGRRDIDLDAIVIVGPAEHPDAVVEATAAGRRAEEHRGEFAAYYAADAAVDRIEQAAAALLFSGDPELEELAAANIGGLLAALKARRAELAPF